MLALLVGVGISVFYPAPQSTQYPDLLSNSSGREPTERQFAEQEKAEKAYEKKQRSYETRSKTYNRQVAAITLAISILVVALTLTVLRTIAIISDGLLLGGLFILVYSIIRAFTANDTRLSFLVVSVGFVMTLVVGYFQFIAGERVAQDTPDPTALSS